MTDRKQEAGAAAAKSDESNAADIIEDAAGQLSNGYAVDFRDVAKQVLGGSKARIAELEAQLAAEPAPGWKVVPVQPTPEMCAEGLEDEGVTIKDGRRYAFALYSVMVAVAPPQPQQIAAPAVVGLKPAHVGDSRFESWFSEYNPAGLGTKQQMRDAYAAGMGDPKVQPAPAVEGPVAIVAVSPGHVSVGWMGGYVPKHNDKLYTAPQPQQIAGLACWCQVCRPITWDDMRMVFCPTCGNKRCPRANDHRNPCAGSNEPGQPGSAYTSNPTKEPS